LSIESCFAILALCDLAAALLGSAEQGDRDCPADPVKGRRGGC